MDTRRLVQALESEHCDACQGDNSCDVSAAFEAGLYLWAGHLLAGAGEFYETADALGALAPTQEQLDAERDELCAMPHVRCEKCNAVCWGDDLEECGSCGADLPIDAIPCAECHEELVDSEGDICSSCVTNAVAEGSQ